ncbi:MAG: hypothetical protein K0S41_1117 [Anaerocolumna sp.]|jgi:hypothetical protein|nr:hypothetical protein [Anaerocolumna sp.]
MLAATPNLILILFYIDIMVILIFDNGIQLNLASKNLNFLQ